MTIPYNSSWFSCFKTFKNELEKDDIYYNNLEEKEKNKILKIHKEFYENLKINLKTEFYENNNKNLIIFKYNNWKIVNIGEYKINYKKARDKYTNLLYMLEEDQKTTKNALEANNMHFLDAELVRHILNKFEILSVHDCFGIRISELHLIIDEINKYYSSKINKDTYSIHIIV